MSSMECHAEFHRESSSAEFHGVSPSFRGAPWNSMENSMEAPWKISVEFSVEFRGKSTIISISTKLRETPWNSVELRGAPW